MSLGTSRQLHTLFLFLLPLFFSPRGCGEYFQDVKPLQDCLSACTGSGERTHRRSHPSKKNTRQGCVMVVPSAARRHSLPAGFVAPTFIPSTSAPCSPNEGCRSGTRAGYRSHVKHKLNSVHKRKLPGVVRNIMSCKPDAAKLTEAFGVLGGFRCILQLGWLWIYFNFFLK